MAVTFEEIRQMAKQLAKKRTITFHDAEQMSLKLQEYVLSLPPELRKTYTIILTEQGSIAIKREDYPHIFLTRPDIAQKLIEVWSKL